MKVGETTVRGREYPWGVVEIENEQHCDFVKLREMLIRTNMEDLREVGECRLLDLVKLCRLSRNFFVFVESAARIIVMWSTQADT